VRNLHSTHTTREDVLSLEYDVLICVDVKRRWWKTRLVKADGLLNLEGVETCLVNTDI
jgi:hypothetical protein